MLKKIRLHQQQVVNKLKKSQTLSGKTGIGKKEKLIIISINKFVKNDRIFIVLI